MPPSTSLLPRPAVLAAALRLPAVLFGVASIPGSMFMPGR